MSAHLVETDLGKSLLAHRGETFDRSRPYDDLVVWSSPRELDTRFMRPCDGSSCPPIRLVAVVRWWSKAGGG